MVRATASRVQRRRSSFGNGIPHTVIVEVDVIDSKPNRWIGNDMLCCLTIDPELHCRSSGSLPVERPIVGTDGLLRSIGIIDVDWDNSYRVRGVVVEFVKSGLGTIVTSTDPWLARSDGKEIDNGSADRNTELVAHPNCVNIGECSNALSEEGVELESGARSNTWARGDPSAYGNSRVCLSVKLLKDSDCRACYCIRGVCRPASVGEAESRVRCVLGEIGCRYSSPIRFDREVRIVDRNMEDTKNACTENRSSLWTSERRVKSDEVKSDTVPIENVIGVVHGRLFCWW